MLQIPALSLLRESLQNSLINHRNHRRKLGHVTHASYLHHEFVTHTVLSSALSRQLLNDSSAEVFPNSPGRLLHSPANITIHRFFTGQPHPLCTNFASVPFCSVPIYIFLQLRPNLLLMLPQPLSGKNCCSGNVILPLL